MHEQTDADIIRFIKAYFAPQAIVERKKVRRKQVVRFTGLIINATTTPVLQMLKRREEAALGIQKMARYYMLKSKPHVLSIEQNTSAEIKGVKARLLTYINSEFSEIRAEIATLEFSREYLHLTADIDRIAASIERKKTGYSIYSMLLKLAREDRSNGEDINRYMNYVNERKCDLNVLKTSKQGKEHERDRLLDKSEPGKKQILLSAAKRKLEKDPGFKFINKLLGIKKPQSDVAVAPAEQVSVLDNNMRLKAILREVKMARDRRNRRNQILFFLKVGVRVGILLAICYMLVYIWTRLLSLVDYWREGLQQPLDGALLEAVMAGNLTEVSSLLDKATTDYNNSDGQTALMEAAASGNQEIVSLLFNTRVGLEHVDKAGVTALGLAAYYCHPGVVNLLLQMGAYIDHPSFRSMTALMWAAKNGCASVVKILLSKGASMATPRDSQLTTLSGAAFGGHKAVVSLLLQAKANINEGDRTGKTALTWASFHGHISTVNFLLQEGAAVNKEDMDGLTPLMFAAMQGQQVIVLLLLRYGAEPLQQTKKGMSAALFAEKRAHLAVADSLWLEANNTKLVYSCSKDGLAGINHVSEKNLLH